MTSSYRDPNVAAALAYQAEQEQRRKAQEQPNLLDIAGRTALGLGAAALAGAGIRGFMRRNAVRPISVEDLGATAGRAEENVRRAARSTATPPPSRPAPPAGVARQQAAEEFTRQARAERPVGISQIDLNAAQVVDDLVPTAPKALPAARFSPVDYLTQKGYVEAPTTGTPYSRAEVASLARRPAVESAGDAGDRFIQEYEQLAENQARADRRVQAGLREREMQIRGAGERVLAELQQESLVQKQQARTGFNVDQAINALDAAEDQQTGRVKIQLQRNEDLDLGQVEVLEDIADEQRTWMMEQDEPINRVAAQLPDGRPVDQAEGRLIPGDERYEDRLLKTIYQQELEARPPALTKEDMERNIQNSLNRGRRVAAQLPDGRPVDQAEGLDLRTGNRFAIRQGNTEFAPRSTLGTTGLVPGQKILSEQEPQSVAGTSATRFMEAERNKILRELEIDEVSVSPARVDAELARRLGPQASTYGPKYTARAQALQTFANTGDPIAAETIKRFGLRPVTFETFENMPAAKKRLFESAAPMSLEGYPSTELQTVVDPTGIKVNAPGFGVVDISTLRKPVVMESTARQANEFIEGAKADKLDWVQGKINEINEARQGILLERKERIKTAADNLLVNLEQAKASGQNDVVEELGSQLDNLRTMYRNPELVGDYKEFGEGGMRHLNSQLRGVQISTNKQIAALEKRYPTTLANRTGEASRVFGELDVNTGEFIPETMEVRSGRSDVDLGRKGGGGRNIAEYTAGERLDEEIRALQGGGRIRDYDVETGAPVQRWQGDSTQTGRTIDEYGIRLTRQRAADPELRPSVPQYTQQEIEKEALRLSKADPYGDVPMAPEYAEVVESLGYQQPTPERRASVLLSEQVRKGQRSFPKQNINSYPSSILARPVRINFPEETVKSIPTQLSFPSDVVPATAAAARVRVTPADQAAQQLEAYMGRLQRGRTSPLTSQVRIQPSLF